jgi:hypothetical protein
MGLAHSPRIVTTNLLLNVDAGNIKSYNTAANTYILDTVSNSNFPISNNTWISYANSTLTFTRPANTSPNPKIGAVVTNTASGLLASPTFLYNDHTWEVWYRIDDRTPGAYDPTEGFSVIAAYQGFHSGFMHTSTVLEYYIWDSVGPTQKTASSWTVGTSGTQVIQNNWTQIVVTRSGNTFTPYINGVQLGTGSTITTNTFTSTRNTLSIGSASQAIWTAGQGVYAFYSKGTFSNMKMYNRALSAQEIAQNFDALRGRFGI